MVVSATLAACSGNGGGSPGASATAAAADPPVASAAAAPQTFALQNGGSITMSGDGTAAVATGGGTVTVSPTAAAPLFAGGTMLAHQTGAMPDIVIDMMGRSAGLSASDFGAWQSYDGAGALTGTRFYAGGLATAPALLPPPGAGISATYNGLYVATLQSSASYAGATVAAGPFGGSAQLTVDFDAGTVQAKFGGLLADTFSTGSSLDRGAGAYSVNGGSFSPYAAAAYTLHGLFYGAPVPGQAPPETAGTIAGTIGPATATTPAAAFTGSFGAHR